MTKRIALVALILAPLFETLVFNEVPGIGHLVFWMVSVLATTFLLQSAERESLPRLWMFLPSLLLAFSVFRFDAAAVRYYGATLCVLTLIWAVAWNLVSEWKPGVLALLFPRDTWSPSKVLSNSQESLKIECQMEKDSVHQVLRGVIFATALLLVFGTLLAQADAVFGAKLASLQEVFGHISPAPVLRVALWLGLAAGCLKVWLMTNAVKLPQAKTDFSSTELLIALGSLNLLLATFLAVQLRYLFGDSSLVEALGISHAHYARKGFFELSLCIALILPLVLLAYRASEAQKDARLRYLGGGLIACAAGLAVSALKRMLLYIEVYGLSVERFYAAAGILVAMTILAWAAYACCSPKPISWLMERQKVTVIFCLAFLSLVNVDYLVARSHLELVRNGVRTLDSRYISSLSTDALPALTEFRSKQSINSEELAEIQERIKGKAGSTAGHSFNISRSRAERL